MQGNAHPDAGWVNRELQWGISCDLNEVIGVRRHVLEGSDVKLVGIHRDEFHSVHGMEKSQMPQNELTDLIPCPSRCRRGRV